MPKIRDPIISHQRPHMTGLNSRYPFYMLNELVIPFKIQHHRAIQRKINKKNQRAYFCFLALRTDAYVI